MKKTIKAISVGIVCLLLASSCCKDKEYWFPEGVIRYYDINDSISFYCPEDDEYRNYIVCERDTIVTNYQDNGICDYVNYFYAKEYRLFLNNCDDSTFMRVAATASFQDDITVWEIDRNLGSSLFKTRYEDNPKFSIEILDHTYYNVIEISGSDYSPILSILFSYGYGVIQMQYENQTFSLLNNEN
jgi:hypothetical protein